MVKGNHTAARNEVKAHPLQAAAVEASITDPPAAPFLRWAGGKRWLAPAVRENLANVSHQRYFEPFVGGGSMFFGLAVGANASLSDLNAELMAVYAAIRDDPESVSDALDAYTNTEDEYYSARADQPGNDAKRAARFIFLNHTSFNGIYRVNRRGEYNVPFGRRRWVRMPDRAHLVRVSSALAGVDIAEKDFGEALSGVAAGDLVFLDPPYTVAHNQNGFIKYNQNLFSFEDQIRLAEAIRSIVEIGAHFILTNAAHPSIDELFSPYGNRVLVSRQNSVGGTKASRGRAEEYLFTNIHDFMIRDGSRQ